MILYSKVTTTLGRENTMSTSLIYHAFGCINYNYIKTCYKKGNVYFFIHRKLFKIRCPECNSKNVIFKGSKTRYLKTIPIGKKPVFLAIKIHRIKCKDCNCIKQTRIEIADPKKTYTRAFARYVLELLKFSTINDVAHHLNISWDTVKDIQKKYLIKNFRQPDLSQLSQIAIDEISIGKKHKYLTIVLDLQTGAVVFIGNGKGSDSLNPFWESLKKANIQIKAVATDMSKAYIHAVRENLPNAIHVFDHFHIIKLFNEKLTKLRHQLYHETTSYHHSQALKGLRWILLKNPENLDETKNEKERLEQALRINKPLATVYYLKEDLRQLWNQKSKAEAEIFIEEWIRKARASGVRILVKFSNTLSAYRTAILAYYDYPISTGPLEGTNNKIKTMQRQSYGYRDKEFFKLKIFALHHSRYALIG